MLYLEFAEIQALERKPMYMRDWIAKLDDFLRVSGREVLTHKGLVSHAEALAKAQAEYERYRQIRLDTPTPVEGHFADSVKSLETKAKALDKSRPRRKRLKKF